MIYDDQMHTSRQSKSSSIFMGTKKELEHFLASIGCPVTWKRIDNPVYPWFTPFKLRAIFHDNVRIGTFGMIDDAWCAKVVPHGCFAHMSAFDINGDFFATNKKPVARYVPLSKYPDAPRALSLWLPLKVTAAEVHEAIAAVDTRIAEITLIDVLMYPTSRIKNH